MEVEWVTSPKNTPWSADSGHTAAYLAYFCLLSKEEKQERGGTRGRRWVFFSLRANTNAALNQIPFNTAVLSACSDSLQSDYPAFRFVEVS